MSKGIWERPAARLRSFGILAIVLLGAACSGPRNLEGGLDPVQVSRAVSEATALRASGGRVWCVPFARDASGIQLRGDAHTWWKQARGQYGRGKKPVVGSVISFSAGRTLTRGHIAVVSDIVSERVIKVHHANWHRDKVSLDMLVKDVSPRGDWSQVKVMTNPGAYGSTYPVDGFIYNRS